MVMERERRTYTSLMMSSRLISVSMSRVNMAMLKNLRSIVTTSWKKYRWSAGHKQAGVGSDTGGRARQRAVRTNNVTHGDGEVRAVGDFGQHISQHIDVGRGDAVDARDDALRRH